YHADWPYRRTIWCTAEHHQRWHTRHDSSVESRQRCHRHGHARSEQRHGHRARRFQCQALDSQRDAALKNLDGTKTVNNITANFDNLSSISDRTDLSRIEIVSGNTVEFKQGSLTLATGGQIAVAAKQRTLVGNGAELDVSGAIGVQVSMESNNLKINVQGNELRDA
ncbi:hypothetical protein, partial [Herbaspirillum autotrophicum]|uniref:hypothetical protein n=1 Tax=Herbaspirillum autotrophicum TaxID=180195 RepID=UPI0018DC6C17